MRERNSMAGLKQEILQKRPFASLEEEALLNLLRTADSLSRALQQKARDWGVTVTQYNVLRILRGARPEGLSCSVIGSRMIAAEPDMTRLLARLKAHKLIRQKRDARDRRAILSEISAEGLKLLEEMEPSIESLPAKLLGELKPAELTELIRLLELARLRGL
jgi:DNA-binding MarR family transcriptional regulator